MTDDPAAAAVGRFRAAAEARGIPVEVRPRPAASSLAEAARLLGLATRDIAKTLVIRLAEGRYVLVMVDGDSQIGWPKLRSLLGVNKLSLPDADLARQATGYERGTITPIGSAQDWPLIVDERLVGRRVAMGAGAHGYSAFVAVDDLVRGYGATVADVAG